MSETTPAPKPDIRFAITITKNETYAYDSQHYRHFQARAYVLGVNKYGKSQRPELLDPSDYSVAGRDRTRALAGLVITAQADSDSMKRPGSEWYGQAVKYDRYTVELKDAEEMLPVLRKIDRTMRKLTAEFGYPATLVQFCTYAARALTSHRQPFLCAVSADHDWEGTGYRSMDADALSYHLSADASEWREAHGIKPTES
jgi:hypothetical protein